MLGEELLGVFQREDAVVACDVLGVLGAVLAPYREVNTLREENVSEETKPLASGSPDDTSVSPGDMLGHSQLGPGFGHLARPCLGKEVGDVGLAPEGWVVAGFLAFLGSPIWDRILG